MNAALKLVGDATGKDVVGSTQNGKTLLVLIKLSDSQVIPFSGSITRILPRISQEVYRRVFLKSFFIQGLCPLSLIF